MDTTAILPAPFETGFRYARLAGELESKIIDGVYRVGDKLPSIRKLHGRTGLSIATVYQAYIELEKRGLIEVRPKSGYYVKPLLQQILPAPALKKHRAVPQKVSIGSLAHTIVEAMSDPSILQLGGTSVAPDLLPSRQIAKIIKTAPFQSLIRATAVYEQPYGDLRLKRQISRRMFHLSKEISLDEIIVTNGCIEAVNLCLQSVAEAGDTVVVESPTYPWFLQLIDDLNMYALELPTDPQSGIDLDSLEQALNRNDVKACLLVPAFHNPMGFSMCRDNKQRLLELTGRKNVPIIEDDIHAELYFGKSRPMALKSLDRNGMVMYCSSFSKNLAPGLRVGWAMPGKFTHRVQRRKLNMSIASSTVGQYAIATYLETGAWDRHLRTLRNALKNQVSNTALSIARHFPGDTRITAPKGGLVLWVQLGGKVDSLDVFNEARKKKISILPGTICSTTQKYDSFIRISCGFPWHDAIDKGIQTLGEIIHRLRGGPGRQKSETMGRETWSEDHVI